MAYAWNTVDDNWSVCNKTKLWLHKATGDIYKHEPATKTFTHLRPSVVQVQKEWLHDAQKPICVNGGMAVMQGRRPAQEDRALLISDFLLPDIACKVRDHANDLHNPFMLIVDGHGGKEAADFVLSELPNAITTRLNADRPDTPGDSLLTHLLKSTHKFAKTNTAKTTEQPVLETAKNTEQPVLETAKNTDSPPKPSPTSQDRDNSSTSQTTAAIFTTTVSTVDTNSTLNSNNTSTLESAGESNGGGGVAADSGGVDGKAATKRSVSNASIASPKEGEEKVEGAGCGDVLSSGRAEAERVLRAGTGATSFSSSEGMRLEEGKTCEERRCSHSRPSKMARVESITECQGLSSIAATSQKDAEEASERIAAALVDAFEAVDEEFLKVCRTARDGCTVTAACALGRTAYVANCGDSRAVLVSQVDGSWAVQRMTIDHKPSLPSERLRIEAHGGQVRKIGPCWRVLPPLLEPTPVRGAPRSFEANFDRPPVALAVSRAFGDRKFKHNKLVIPTPQVRHVHLDPSQHRALIIATDGVWDVLTDNCVMDLSKSFWPNKPREAASEIVSTAYRKNSFDNISCMVIFFEEK